MAEPPREPRWHEEPRSSSKRSRERSADRGSSNKRRTKNKNDNNYYGNGDDRDRDEDRGRDRNRDRYGDKDTYGRERERKHHSREREGRGYRTEPSSANGRRESDPRDDDDRRGYGTSSRPTRASGNDRSSWDDRRDEWNCIECQTWNDIQFTSCDRCRCPQPRGRSETRGRAVEEKEVDKEVDEFGRKNDAVPAGPRWPPPFDRRSATYVFDSRSGMFYHASSQFFFDPKTKLYYGNKEQKYYVYCRGEKPPFQEFKQEAVSPEDISQKAKVVGKKVIAISLKTKVLASSAKDDEEQKKEQAKARIALVSRTKKLHDTNIDRWSERVRELSGKEQVVRTKTGDPVCLLCKRKFSDLQKLDQHENLSELHKTNLSKYSKRRNINEEMAAAHYRDRAFERRILHGTDDIAAAPFVHSEDVPDSVVGPQETLGESNVGNKMLQKLGWKSGTNLGRNAGGESTGGSLKKDWERIEHLAKSGNRK